MSDSPLASSTCALVKQFTWLVGEFPQVLRCWGSNLRGSLGYGHTEPLGDNEAVLTLFKGGNVNHGVPSNVVKVSSGPEVICTAFENGVIKCAGADVHGGMGAGAGVKDIGDNERRPHR